MKKAAFIIHLGTIIFLTTATLASAQTDQTVVNNNFIPLVGVPFVQGGQVHTFGDYIKAMYIGAITVAAFLAVIQILIAGVKYMLTDVVSTKGNARDTIRSSIVGLLIVVGAVLILNTINPNLTHTNVLSNAPVPPVQGLDQTTVTATPVSVPGCPFQTESQCYQWCQSQAGGGTYVKTGTSQAVCNTGTVDNTATNDAKTTTGSNCNDGINGTNEPYCANTCNQDPTHQWNYQNHTCDVKSQDAAPTNQPTVKVPTIDQLHGFTPLQWCQNYANAKGYDAKSGYCTN